MAMTASMQSLLTASSPVRFGRQSRSKSATTQFVVASRLPAQNKSVVQVRCMATDPLKKEETPKPKPNTNLSDLFAFSGPAPERINGRLAMIGFVAAIAVEASKGTDLFTQISDGGGLQWFLGTTILLSAASLVPLLKGVRAEGKTEGVMNSNAELWNGRFAMVGLVALALTEYVTGSALV